MTKLEKIQLDIAALYRAHFWSFAAWFNEPQDARRDAEMDPGMAAGKFDTFAKAAPDVRAAGLNRPLQGIS